MDTNKNEEPNEELVEEDKECKEKFTNPLIISIFEKTFWDLWLQKLFRNIASVKYQWLMLLYV